MKKILDMRIRPKMESSNAFSTKRQRSHQVKYPQNVETKDSRERCRIAKLRLGATTIPIRPEAEQISPTIRRTQSPNTECDRFMYAQETDSCVDVGAHEPYGVDEGH